MIEIIKRGTKKSCTCKECGCYFSYEDEDIKSEKQAHTNNTMFGVVQSISYNKSIICPQCETVIVLEQTK